MMPSQAFFTLHRDLPREGPGVPEDVHWALDMAGTPPTAHILDAASGPGADTVTLAEARPNATIEAIDITAHFVDEAARRTARFGTRVKARQGDYTDLDGQFDLIWCAGAAYFNGFLNSLSAWRDHLATDGAIAFSEPALVSEPPSSEVNAFWEGEGDIHGLPRLQAMLESNGWRIEGHRWLIGAPWEAYYGPKEARLKRLKSEDPDPELLAVLEHSEREIALWRENRDEIAYALFVVRPA